MCLPVSYQKDSSGATSDIRAESTIRQLVAMLQAGSADPVFIAHRLARYAGQVPEIEPLVLGLAASFNATERTNVLNRMRAAQARAAAESGPLDRIGRNPGAEASVQPEPLECRVDPELGRLALGMNLTAPLRVWLVLREHFGNPGWTHRQTLYKALQSAGIDHSKRHYNRLLREGEGVFWGLAEDGRVWLRGVVRVVIALTEKALEENPDLIETNRPGARDIYIRVDGPLKHFKARLYAAWLAHRENPKIARATLCKLFACTKETLWAWEETLTHTLEVVSSYTQTAIDPKEDDRVVDFIPDHAYTYLTRQHQVRIRWQSPNVYRTKLVRQHARKGQSRKVRMAAAKVIRDSQPAERRAGGRLENKRLAFGRGHWESRQYFATADRFRAFLKRLRARNVVSEVAVEAPRYVFRGYDRYEHAIYELPLDREPQTGAWERISVRKEYVWRAGEARHRKGWMRAMAG